MAVAETSRAGVHFYVCKYDAVRARAAGLSVHPLASCGTPEMVPLEADPQPYEVPG